MSQSLSFSSSYLEWHTWLDDDSPLLTFKSYTICRWQSLDKKAAVMWLKGNPLWKSYYWNKDLAGCGCRLSHPKPFFVWVCLFSLFLQDIQQAARGDEEKRGGEEEDSDTNQ